MHKSTRMPLCETPAQMHFGRHHLGLRQIFQGPWLHSQRSRWRLLDVGVEQH